MKKRLLSVIIVSMCISLTACGEQQVEKEQPKTEESQKQEELDDTPQTDNPEEKNETEENETIENEAEGTLNLNIYFTNQDTGELDSKEVLVSELDEQMIWNEIQKLNNIDSGAKVLAIEVDENNKSMILDLNKKFGEQLRSVGTTQESELIKVLVYTYLDAYQCDQIMLKEEGAILESSHKEYADYLEKK